MDSSEIERKLGNFSRITRAVRDELGRVLVGQDAIVGAVLTSFFAGSHVLLEGVPGLGKTLLVKSLADVLGLPSSRIQFTPDLMPADVIGTTVITEGDRGDRVFSFRKGPLFSSVVLADEINRATPKTQSALLEAMQERQITTGGTTYDLGQPYFVLATQNPLEMEGTYPLPEAQLDRFFMKVVVPFPTEAELRAIVTRTTGEALPRPNVVTERAELLELLELVRAIPVPTHVVDQVVRIVLRTHPEHADAPPSIRKYVKVGASPRGAQALLLASKIRALLEGRVTAASDDVRASLAPTLRHRVLLNFEGEADRVDVDRLLSELDVDAKG